MTVAGWIFMALFWGFILVTTGWCFRIVLFEKSGFGKDDEEGPGEG